MNELPKIPGLPSAYIDKEPFETDMTGAEGMNIFIHLFKKPGTVL
jgi:hypothetical protein